MSLQLELNIAKVLDRPLIGTPLDISVTLDETRQVINIQNLPRNRNELIRRLRDIPEPLKIQKVGGDGLIIGYADALGKKLADSDTIAPNLTIVITGIVRAHYDERVIRATPVRMRVLRNRTFHEFVMPCIWCGTWVDNDGECEDCARAARAARKWLAKRGQWTTENVRCEMQKYLQSRKCNVGCNWR